MHHVKHIRKGEVKGFTVKGWTKRMKQLNRKQKQKTKNKNISL